MVMVGVEASSHWTFGPPGGLSDRRLTLAGWRAGGLPAMLCISPDEPGELSQWLCHDDSTIDIVVLIIIIF